MGTIYLYTPLYRGLSHQIPSQRAHECALYRIRRHLGCLSVDNKGMLSVPTFILQHRKAASQPTKSLKRMRKKPTKSLKRMRKKSTMIMNKILFTADLHFDHTNTLKHQPNRHLTFFKSEDASHLLEKLTGQKFLIQGNHDGSIRAYSKVR